MTVSYTADVANASRLGCFTKILRRWKGSVYKLIYKELAAYIFCYFVLNIFYRTALCQPGTDFTNFNQKARPFCNEFVSPKQTWKFGVYIII